MLLCVLFEIFYFELLDSEILSAASSIALPFNTLPHAWAMPSATTTTATATLLGWDSCYLPLSLWRRKSSPHKHTSNNSWTILLHKSNKHVLENRPEIYTCEATNPDEVLWKVVTRTFTGKGLPSQLTQSVCVGGACVVRAFVLTTLGSRP